MTDAELLKRLPVFASLGTDELAGVARQTVEQGFARGEVLFLEGENCPGLYLVKSGQVRLFKSSPEGREQVLFMALPGDSLNEVPVFDGGTNPASCVAVTDTTVFLVPTAAVLALIAASPAARAMLKVFAGRQRHLTVMVEDLSFRSVVARVAKLLLELAVTAGGPAPVKRLTQDEMAAMVGSVRDVVGRALKLAAKRGAIKIEGQRITIIAPAKLKALT